MSSLWQATTATPCVRPSVFGMPEYSAVRSDEAKQGHNQGWHR